MIPQITHRRIEFVNGRFILFESSNIILRLIPFWKHRLSIQMFQVIPNLLCSIIFFKLYTLFIEKQNYWSNDLQITNIQCFKPFSIFCFILFILKFKRGFINITPHYFSFQNNFHYITPRRILFSNELDTNIMKWFIIAPLRYKVFTSVETRLPRFDWQGTK